jgi:hypothetical protein
MKYIHSKTSSFLREKKDLEDRKASNHKTVEQIYGFFHPQFGGSLGALYDRVTGAIKKNNRNRNAR